MELSLEFLEQGLALALVRAVKLLGPFFVVGRFLEWVYVIGLQGKYSTSRL